MRYVISILFALTASTHAQVRPWSMGWIPRDSLIAVDFTSGVAKDWTPNRRTITLVGSPTVGSSGLVLNGTSQYIDVSTSNDFNRSASQEWVSFVLFKPTSTNTSMCVSSRAQNGAPYKGWIYMWDAGLGQMGWYDGGQWLYASGALNKKPQPNVWTERGSGNYPTEVDLFYKDGINFDSQPYTAGNHPVYQQTGLTYRIGAVQDGATIYNYIPGTVHSFYYTYQASDLKDVLANYLKRTPTP